MIKHLLISKPKPGDNIFLMGKSYNMDHEKSNVALYHQILEGDNTCEC